MILSAEGNMAAPAPALTVLSAFDFLDKHPNIILFYSFGKMGKTVNTRPILKSGTSQSVIMPGIKKPKHSQFVTVWALAVLWTLFFFS